MRIVALTCFLLLTSACGGDDGCPDILPVSQYEDLSAVAIVVELSRSCTDLPCDAADEDSVSVTFEGDASACYTPPDDVVVRFNALETDRAGGGLSEAVCECFPTEAFSPGDPLSSPGEELRIEWADPIWTAPVVLELPATSIDHQIALTLPADGTASPGDELTLQWTIGTSPSVQFDLLDEAGEVAVALAPDGSTGTHAFVLPADLAPGTYRLVGFVNTTLCDRATCGATTYVSVLVDAEIEVAL